MKTFIQVSMVVLLTSAVVITATYVYKLFEWERIDVLNIATLSTAIIAIIALIFNARQFLLNKEKVMHERGEFRLGNHYQSKFNRIQELEVTSIVNQNVVNKGRTFHLTPMTVNRLQHYIIEYLINSYGQELGIEIIYQIKKIGRGKLEQQFLEVLNQLHKDIAKYSPWIFSYHKGWIDLIAEICKDNRLSTDQKESTISKILQNNIMGYNYVINDVETNNFNLVSFFDPEIWLYEPIGYLDFIKTLLPTKKYFHKSLGKFKYLMDEQLPK